MLRQENKPLPAEIKTTLPKITGLEIKNILDNYAKTKNFLQRHSITMKHLKIFYQNNIQKNAADFLSLQTLFDLLSLLAKNTLGTKGATYKALHPLINKFTAEGFTAILQYFSHETWPITLTGKRDDKTTVQDLECLIKNPIYAYALEAGLLILKNTSVSFSASVIYRKLLADHPENAKKIAQGILTLITLNFETQDINALARKYPDDFESMAKQMNYAHLILWELKHLSPYQSYPIKKEELLEIYLHSVDARPFLNQLVDHMPLSPKAGKSILEERYIFITNLLIQAQKDVLMPETKNLRLKLFDETKKAPEPAKESKQEIKAATNKPA